MSHNITRLFTLQSKLNLESGQLNQFRSFTHLEPFNDCLYVINKVQDETGIELITKPI